MATTAELEYWNTGMMEYWVLGSRLQSLRLGEEIEILVHWNYFQLTKGGIFQIFKVRL